MATHETSIASPEPDAGEAPLVSIVSPFFNRRHCLTELIATLERQTFRDFELIISDDGSTDGLANDVMRVKTEFPVRYLRFETNRGGAAARNAGIDAARSRYIALLDSDDAWHPEKLRLQLVQLEAESGGALVSLTRQVVMGARNYVAPSRLMRRADRVGSYLFLEGGIIQSSMMMLRRDLATRVRFDDESTGHDDWSFALRLEAAGASFEMLGEPLTLYDDSGGRLRRSPAYSASRLEWLSARRQQIGDLAYWAAVAAVASRLPSGPQSRPLHLIATAYRNGAISLVRAAYYALAWALPPTRTLVREASQIWAGRHHGRAG